MVKPRNRVAASATYTALLEFDANVKTLLSASKNGTSFDSLSSRQWDELLQIIDRALQSHFGHNEESSSGVVQEVLSLLEKIVKNRSDLQECEALQQILKFINGDHQCDEKVKGSICKVNEAWLNAELPFVVGMDAFTLSHLLKLVTVEKPLIGDMKRLYTLRASFQISVIDNHLPQIQKAVQNAVFASNEHGTKFLGSIAAMSEHIFVSVFNVVSLELSSCSKSSAVAYGKILMLAWHTAEESLKTCMQTRFQRLMEEFLKLRRSSLELSKRGSNILHLVDVWNIAVRKKGNDGFLAMITQCYQPFLWKYLQSGLNYQRCNAADLFLKAFPLHVPGDPEAENRLLLEQVQHMENALRDDCHIVRVIAIREVLNILSVYWSEFSTDQIKRIITIIIKEDACDTSSPEVRRMVWRGLESFVDHERPFEYLKEFLPALGKYVNDVNQSVRTAFIKLLIKIREKGDPSFKFTAVAKISLLLNILKIENQAVGRQIVRLLLPSMYHSEMESTEWIRRFAALIRNFPHSYRNFFLYSNITLPFEDALAIMCELIVNLGGHVMRKTKEIDNDDHENDSTLANSSNIGPKKRSKIDESSQSNTSAAAKATVFEDPAIVTGIFDIITILWVLHDNNINKPENREDLAKLMDACVRFSACLISYYKGTPIFDSVISVAGNIPAAILKANSITLPGYCMKELKTLEVEEGMKPTPANVTMMVALVKWGYGSKILEQVTLWLEDAFESASVPSLEKAVKRVKITETIQPNSLLAIHLLDELFSRDHTKQHILRKNYKELRELWKFMSTITELLYRRFMRGSPYSDSLLSDEFLVTCFYRYVKLIPLLHATKPDLANADDATEDVFNCQVEMMNVVEWAHDDLVPLLHAEAENCPDSAMIAKVLNHVLTVSENMITCNLIDHQTYGKLGELVTSLLSCYEYNLHFVNAAGRFTVALSFATKLRSGSEGLDEFSVWSMIVPSMCCLILNVLVSSSHAKANFDEFSEDLLGLRTSMTKIFAAYESNFEVRNRSKESVRSALLLVEKIMSAVRSILCREVPRSDMSVPVYSTLSSLPIAAATILAPVFNKKLWTPMFLALLKQHLGHTEKTLLIDVLILHLFGKIESNKWVVPIKATMEEAHTRLSQFKNRRESAVRQSLGLTMTHVEPPPQRPSNADDDDSPTFNIPEIRVVGSDGCTTNGPRESATSDREGTTTVVSRDSNPSNMATVGTESRNSQPTMPSQSNFPPISEDMDVEQPQSGMVMSQPLSTQATVTSSQPASSQFATMGSSQPVSSQARVEDPPNIKEDELIDDFISSAEALLQTVEGLLAK